MRILSSLFVVSLLLFLSFSTQATHFSGVVINEILPSPEGPNEKDEWIEIFNKSELEVELSNWQITDTAGKTRKYTFPKGTKIPSQGFLVLSRPTTKITLNNDNDGLNLIQADGEIVDSVMYQKAPRGQSYNLTESGSRATAKGEEESLLSSPWQWSTLLTPGSKNTIPAPVSEAKKTEPKRSELAAVSGEIPEKPSFPTFFIALIIAASSGIIILTLKRKVEKL